MLRVYENTQNEFNNKKVLGYRICIMEEKLAFLKTKILGYQFIVTKERRDGVWIRSIYALVSEIENHFLGEEETLIQFIKAFFRHLPASFSWASASFGWSQSFLY